MGTGCVDYIASVGGNVLLSVLSLTLLLALLEILIFTGSLLRG